MAVEFVAVAVLASVIGMSYADDGGCPVSAKVRGHENTEWSIAYGFHLTDGQKDLPRALLVGDSICNGYQEGVRERVEGKMAVSYWISSYCVTSPGYMKLLAFQLDESRFDVIHFNNGLHSLLTPTEAYAAALKKAFLLIREKQPWAKIVWATSTPLNDPVKTAKAKELNAAARPIVKELGNIEVNDLFALLEPLDRETNWSDVYHHKPSARALEADQVAKLLLSFGSPSARRDYASDSAFRKNFHDAIVEIARKKCFPAKPERGLKAHIGTGGNFCGYFLWDTCFNVLWGAKEPKGAFPVLESMDNLYALADEEGFVNRQFEPDGSPSWGANHPISFAPPLMSWAEHEIFKSGYSDVARLREVYPKLARHHKACARKFRRTDGLYFGDWFGCGMDDLPRWPKDMDRAATIASGVKFTKATMNGNLRRWDERVERLLQNYHWNSQAGWIDMSSQMALDALSLARIAAAIGKDAESAIWKQEHAALAATINAKCWSESLCFYCDYGPSGIIPRRHAGGFWVLISEVATKERAANVVKTLTDPELFYREIPFPTLPKNDPDYGPENPRSYSRGVVWPPTNYSLILGLRAYGYKKEADGAAHRWYNAFAELFTKYGTVMENISPEQCRDKRLRSQGDFCGWAALVPIALPKEFNWKN